MSDPTLSIRPINGNWHLVVTTHDREEIFPAGTELHAKVMMDARIERREREKAGLPPIVRR